MTFSPSLTEEQQKVLDWYLATYSLDELSRMARPGPPLRYVMLGESRWATLSLTGRSLPMSHFRLASPRTRRNTRRNTRSARASDDPSPSDLARGRPR